METHSQNIFDTDESRFAADVVEASAHQLVMVDFWADWCGPCRALAPVLEKLVGEYDGAVRLVKVNADEQQGLCADYGVRSLPTVYFFHQGNVVEQFMGVQPEPNIRELIDKYVSSQSGLVLQQAQLEYDSGNVDTAIHLVNELLRGMPDNEEAKLVLVSWLAEAGRLEDAEPLAETLSRESKETPQYQAFLAKLEFHKSAESLPQTDELREAIAMDENNLDARSKLAKLLVLNQQYEEALEQLLEVVKRDRKFNDDEARQDMLKVFQLLGGKGELVSKYRRQLALTLN